MSDERGATAIVVALLMTGMLASAALAVDVGALHAEKRELENGADAAVLAMARDCAVAVADAGCSSRSTAAQWLDANASDGSSRVIDLVVDTAQRSVTVRAGAADAGGRPGVAMQFASVLGIRRRDVRATSTARWGYPASKPHHHDGTEYPSLPLTIDGCEYDGATNGGKVFRTPVVIVFHQGGGSADAVHPCATNASGQDSPGNFGWIDRAADCQAQADGIGPTGGDNGNDPPNGCEGRFRRLVGEEITLPMFRVASGNGSHATYTIVGWATFVLTGYKLGGSSAWEAPAGHAPCDGGDRCIAGYFVREAVEATPGGQDFGSASVSLTKTPKGEVVDDGGSDGNVDAPTTTTTTTTTTTSKGNGNSTSTTTTVVQEAL